MRNFNKNFGKTHNFKNDQFQNEQYNVNKEIFL